MGNNYVLDGVPVFTVEVGDAMICFPGVGRRVAFVQNVRLLGSISCRRLPWQEGLGQTKLFEVQI